MIKSDQEEEKNLLQQLMMIKSDQEEEKTLLQQLMMIKLMKMILE